MKRADEQRVDVVLVACGTSAAAPAHELRRELVDRGLAVRIDLMPQPSVAAVPAEFLQHTKEARFTVVFMELNEDAAGKPGKSVAYIAAPAPTKRGAVPRFGGIGALTAAAGVETGRVIGGLSELAGRIARRLKA